MYLLSCFPIKVNYFDDEPLIFVIILLCDPSSNLKKDMGYGSHVTPLV
ncbi:hypothetical protein HanXRQr2_Chr15g0698621 [Helianthus annuus]|uniref:Uncharacterized protein n=1 Tax=Helianthus annuus TaxID=4232 RepID=A0A9K3E199_HELAN|nr:hypothetical protein HanXRQr2_Chr15g0698621 [Helianthus annuus]KAJ0831716.1 hypothetical protein HanPSC8_Chr15g0670291 [Helianthus annuus]